MMIQKSNWAQKLAAEFTARDNDTNPVWSSAICTSPVWDEEEEEYVGPFLASAYDGQIVLDENLCCGDVSGYHEGMTLYFTGNPFNGSKVLVHGNMGGKQDVLIAGDGIKISSATISYYPDPKVDLPTVVTSPNTTAHFSVADMVQYASGFSYQWQVSTTDGARWQNSTSTGCETTTLSVNAITARNGYMYRCIITGSSGSVTTQPAKLIVI